QLSCGVAVANAGPFPTSVGYAYAYDPIGRLTTAQCTAGGQSAPQWSLGVGSPLTYDDNGNFRSVTLGDATSTYTYQPGTDFAINTDGGTETSYTPGPGGVVASAVPRGISSIQYDQLSSRPSTIRMASGGSLSFAYDNRGRRVQKTSP